MTKDKVSEDEGAVRDRTTKYTEVLIGLMEDGSVFFYGLGLGVQVDTLILSNYIHTCCR